MNRLQPVFISSLGKILTDIPNMDKSPAGEAAFLEWTDHIKYLPPDKFSYETSQPEHLSLGRSDPDLQRADMRISQLKALGGQMRTIASNPNPPVCLAQQPQAQDWRAFMDRPCHRTDCDNSRHCRGKY